MIKTIFTIAIIGIVLYFGAIFFLGKTVVDNVQEDDRSIMERVGSMTKKIGEDFDKGFNPQEDSSTFVVDTNIVDTIK